MRKNLEDCFEDMMWVLHSLPSFSRCEEFDQIKEKRTAVHKYVNICF